MSRTRRPTAEGNPPSRASGSSGGLTKAHKAIFVAIAVAATWVAFAQSSSSELDPDECEHLHAAWLWSRGVQPYTGFFEHHPPLFWHALRPVVVAADRGDLMGLVMSARRVTWLAFLAVVVSSWWLFRTLFGADAAWAGAALVGWCLASWPTPVQVRPDMFSLALLLPGTAAAVAGTGLSARAKGASPPLAAAGGVLVGLAVCMLTKSIFWAAALAGALLPFAVRAGGRAPGRHRAAYLLFVGAIALVGAIHVAWILVFNDWSAFWRHNVAVNQAMAGSVLRNMPMAVRFWADSLRWPMLSAPLAALGLGCLLGGGDGGANTRARTILTACLLAACVALIVMGNGPWPQYQLPLLVVMGGLAGLAVVYVLARLPGGGAHTAIAGIAIAVVIATVLPVLSDAPNRRKALNGTVAALQRVLDDSGPDDTYLAVQHLNPVFMMDADATLFTRLVVQLDRSTVGELADAIAAKRPRYVMGFNMNVWTAEGKFTRLTPASLGQATADYAPFDNSGYILVRKDSRSAAR